MLAFASQAIFEAMANNDLSITGQSYNIIAAKSKYVYVCMLLCSKRIECASIWFKNNECKLFNSVNSDYFVDSVGTIIYRRKKVLGLNLGYD